MSDDSGPWVLANRKNARQIEKINSCLQDTNRNLVALSQQLIQSKELGKEKAAQNEMLMEDLALRSKQLREERQKLFNQKIELANRELEMDAPTSRQRSRMTSPYEGRGADSDLEFGRHSQPDLSVRFFDDMDAGRHLHSLHQSMRDLSSEQRQIRNEIQMLRSASSMDAINPGVARVSPALQIKKEVEEIVGKRLEALRRERNEERLRDVPAELTISPELRQVLNQLSQGEDAKQSTTLNVMREHQQQLNKVNDDNSALKLLVSQLQQQIRELMLSGGGGGGGSVQEQKRKAKDELQDTKAGLSRYSDLVAEHNILKQQLEQSEKQREQLSEHIEVLNRSLEGKEKNDRRIFQQLQNTVDEQREAESAKHHALSVQRDLESRLGEANRRLQIVSTEKNDLQVDLQTAAKRNEDLKTQAQLTVKLWKQKNQKLEKFKDLYEEAKSQNERLTRELVQLRSRDGSSVQSFDKLKRDISELMRSNAQLSEELHLKDVQLSELVMAKMDLTKDLMDNKSVIERLENELHVVNEKIRMVNQNRNLLEDQLNAVQSTKLKSESIIHQLQRELGDVIVSRKELISQITQLKSDKTELALNVLNLKQLYNAAKEEAINSEHRSKEGLRELTSKLESSQKEVTRLQDSESNKIKELTIRLKKDQAEFTAEIQASKLEIEEQRATIRLQRKQINGFQEETKRLLESLAKNEETNDAIQQNLSKIRQQFLNNSFLTEEGLSQSKDLELQLLNSKEEIARQKKNHQNVLFKLAEEIEDLISKALNENPEKFKILTKSIIDEDYFLIDLRDKLGQVKEELTKKRLKENKMKANLREAVIHGERDRQILSAEYERQASQLDHMIPVKNEAFSDSGYSGSVVKSGRSSPFKSSLLENRQQENFDQEREEIRRRYEKQQESVNFLKQELVNLKLFPRREQTVISDIPTRDHDRYPGNESLQRKSPSTAIKDDSLLHPVNRTVYKERAEPDDIPLLHLSDEEFRSRIMKPASLVTAQ